MTLRPHRIARGLAARGAEMAESLRRQAPGARMIGKFAIDHLIRRFMGPENGKGSQATDSAAEPEP